MNRASVLRRALDRALGRTLGGTPDRVSASGRGAAALAVSLLVFAACGDDQPTPGEVRLVVSQNMAVGGAVIELSGEGLLGVRAAPGVSVVARTVSDPGSKTLPRLRVVAIQETPGPLSLIVDVADRDAPLPGATLVQASGVDDALIPASILPEPQVLR